MELIQERLEQEGDKKKTFSFEMISGYTLRIIGTIAMILGHISIFFQHKSMPISYNWIGTIAAPIFVFLLVEGYRHTSNKYIYMVRMYGSYLLMGIVNGFISVNLFGKSAAIKNNMFGTLFLILLHLTFIDFLIDGFKEKNFRKSIFGLIGLILPNLINIGYLFLKADGYIPQILASLIEIVIPMSFFVEGGVIFILLGIMFYLLSENKFKQIIGLIIFSLLNMYYLSGELTYNNLIYQNFQWMMVFAAPFIGLYNGKSGRENKKFFYGFYPLHIYFLYIISYLIG